MSWYGPEALAVVRPTGGLPFGFLLLQYSVLCTVESLSLIYLLFILDLYVLGVDAWISKGSFTKPNIYVSWSTSELRVRLVLWTQFKPSSKIFLQTVPKRDFFYGSFVLFMSCVCHAFTPVHCCLVVTRWERADLLALVCDVKLCFLSLSHMVFRVNCGTWLYWFLIFAAFLPSHTWPLWSTYLV